MRPTPRFLNRINSTMPSYSLNKKNTKPTIGIEPMTSSLPRKCSTTELRGHKKAHSSNPAKRWSGKRDSNPRPSAWKADALANWAIPASSTNLKIQDGEGRIRTSEGWADRFTVCSLWPLGNLPRKVTWCWLEDSNSRPADYKSAALPTELSQLF